VTLECSSITTVPSAAGGCVSTSEQCRYLHRRLAASNWPLEDDMPREWSDGREDRENLVTRQSDREEGEEGPQSQQDSVYK
jgi:hypothetical protein